MSALMWAARKDEQEKAVNELISAGADLNLKNREVYMRCIPAYFS